MQMLKKMFKSDNKYYLELDESLESKPAQQAVKTVKKATEAAQDKVTEALESKPAQQAVKAVKEATEVAQDKVTEASESKPAKSQSSKKSVKKDAPKSEQKTPAKTQPSPKNSGASSFDPPFWVAAMYNNSSTSVNSDGTQAEQTFATDNLMPTVTKSRRTPGPSLSKFKDMAKKAKTPRR